jgi:hypothetical protein
VACSINLNDQVNSRTIEIDNAPAKWVLAPEFESARPLSQFPPEQAFWQGHITP